MSLAPPLYPNSNDSATVIPSDRKEHCDCFSLHSVGTTIRTVIPSDRKEHCDWRESRNLYAEATLAIAGRDSSTRYARSE
jgi:hypothetical protein